MAKTSPKPRVLFVDDEPMVLKGFRLHLRKQFDVHTAESGRDGLKTMETEGPFDVVVSDMRMPGMNGADFLARARQTWPDTIRVLLTGYADTNSAIRAVNEGQIFRFLTKPCRPPDLAAALGDAVAEQRRITADRSLLRSEADRVSERIIEIERQSKLGRLATQSGQELANLAAIHRSMLESAIARADQGEQLTGDDLSELRWIQESLSRHAEHLVEFAKDNNTDATMLDIREATARTLELLQVLGAIKHIDVNADFADELPHVRGVRGRLRHALLNLFVNSLEAIWERSPASPKITIRIDFDADTHCVVVEVTDNGTGIHPEMRPFVFKPYFSTKKEHVGLGLAVASQIAEAHDGDLTFESRYGKGSSFRLSLPPYSPTTETVEGRLREERSAKKPTH
jgi:signal transduction histidine kinase